MKRFKTVVAIALTVLVLLLGIGIYIDTNALEIKTIEIRHASLSPALDGIRIALLSDLHIRAYGHNEKRLLAVLQDKKPDLILLTGDYIRHQGSFSSALKFFKQLHAPVGVYAVLGNTDYSNENGTCILCHDRFGKKRLHVSPIFLKNESIALSWKGRPFYLIGLDDTVHKRRFTLPLPLSSSRFTVNQFAASRLKPIRQPGQERRREYENSIGSAAGKLKPDNPSILIMHSPDRFPELSQEAPLILCGHTHGGQIAVPPLLLKLILDEPSLVYPQGIFRMNRSLMYVSRGIGVSYLPFRFGVKPEITFFDIKNGSGQNQYDISVTESSNQKLYARPNKRLFLETFNVFRFWKTIARKNQRKDNPILFDFEKEEELQHLNWECGKVLRRVKEHATSGSHSLYVRLPAAPDRFTGILFKDIRSDWSMMRDLKMDIYNPNKTMLKLFLRPDDLKSADNVRDHMDREISVEPGMNHIDVPLEALTTNKQHRPLNLREMESMTLYSYGNRKPVEFYLDYIRLE